MSQSKTVELKGAASQEKNETGVMADEEESDVLC